MLRELAYLLLCKTKLLLNLISPSFFSLFTATTDAPLLDGLDVKI